MEPYTSTAYASQEPCWRCGTRLWRLDPPGPGGWRFYCPTCQHLTMTRAEADQALHTMPAGAVGVVAAWPYPLILGSPRPSISPDAEETTDGRFQQSDSHGSSDPRS
jgi:hypothetical protein